MADLQAIVENRRVKKPKPETDKPVKRRNIKSIRLESGLTVEQEAYCRARALGMSPDEAVLTAGCSVKTHTAREWERNSLRVADRIRELAEIATKNAIIKTGLDREWVISRLMQVTERCMQAEPVMEKRGNEWVETGEYKFDSIGANQALRMLGDTMGLFKPAEKKPGDEYAELSDDDIARIVAELAAQTGLVEIGAGTQEATGSQQVIEVQAVPKAD